MNPKLRNGIFIALGLATLIVVAVVITKKLRVVPNTAEGFNGVVEKTKKQHPEIYAWWESLPVEKQINIEKSMSVEVLTYLSNELTKNNLSEEVKQFLRKAGYVG